MQKFFPQTANLLSKIACLTFLAVLSACVTVNVHFPESAVQKATDDYVQELYRAKEKGKTPTTSPSPKTSLLRMIPNLGISSAWAIDLTFKVDSSKALKIRERLSKRLEEVIDAKKSGYLGESKDGLLVVYSKESIKKLLLKKIETLASDENEDREELYKEILTTNSMAKNRLIDVQKSFARSFQNASPSGTWIQADDSQWSQKE